MKHLETFDLKAWEEKIPAEMQKRALASLEQGKVLYLPNLAFNLLQGEESFLSAEYVDPKRKNISYNLSKNSLGGSLWKEDAEQKLKALMKRYAQTTHRFLKSFLPHYASHLILSKTSLRPVEISGRKSSTRKDDTRLHVDAFPSNPTQGFRMLRLFTNINPEGKPRVWKVGEPFEQVVQKFATAVPPPVPGSASLLKFLRITKSKRSLYDHYMLRMHNRMKEDDSYQNNVPKEEIHFPPGSSWVAYTDQVSHAALAGKDLLEQTFFLPLEGLKSPFASPLKILERALKKPLL